MPLSSPTLTRSRLLLGGLLLLTLAVRATALWVMRDNLQQDPDAYREIAENLLRHGEFALGKDDESPIRPTAYRPPLYPVLLSNLPMSGGRHVSLTKVAALHLLLGVSTVWLTWLTARQLCRERETHLPDAHQSVRSTHPTAAPLIAGFLVACDPILLNQQSLVMTETLAAFLAILSLWCLARFDAHRTWFSAALAGGAIGLAILCRPTFLPWLGLVAVVVLVVQGKKSWFAGFGWRAVNVLALSFAAAAIISPWAIRNYQVFHKSVVTTTHGGYTLYLGNNPSFYGYLEKGSINLPWDASSLKPYVFPKDQPLTMANYEVLALLMNEGLTFEGEVQKHGYTNHKELLEDRIAYALAKKCMREHPADCFRACLWRVRQLWSPLPYQLTANESLGRRLLRYATGAWYCALYALSAVGIWRLRGKLFQPPWIWGLLLCLTFTAVHTFYWTNLRMRAPLMPFLAIVAAAAISKSTPGPNRPPLKTEN